ncbi:MAG TPA: hypothetical protein PKE69_22305 [Pyrinomonadaceae bacterium]|nr:hypothetical protein [Pyrinomonadaceae bacterium]
MINEPVYFPVEKTLDEYVEEFGGELVKKLLSNPNFSNADYLFKNYKVVAELKTLEKDFFSAEIYKKKINGLYVKWVKEGLVPRIWGKAMIQTQNLPERCQLEFTNIIKKPLEGRINKANKQIKETKKHFGIEDYKGVLILVSEFAGRRWLRWQEYCSCLGNAKNFYFARVSSMASIQSLSVKSSLSGFPK